MGFIIKSWYIIWVFFCSFCRGNNHTYSSDSLHATFHDYAQKELEKHHTGTLYEVPLPANFSGMNVSVVRLRSGSFWTRGANFTSFQIPPRILPMPYVKRLALLYQNLGNWSSYYYNVPGFLLVTPVVGFEVYDVLDSNVIGNTKLHLILQGDPISVNFSGLLAPGHTKDEVKCVEFGAGGLLNLTRMTKPNVCLARGQGHFGVVIPSSGPIKKKDKFWKWWVVGFGGGFVVLVLVGLIAVFIYKLVRRKKIREMERESEKGVDFDTIWIGRSKLPSATSIRTQPAVLENEYDP